jgi:hypothetical protein
MTALVYNRTIAVHRPVTVAATGGVTLGDYSGVQDSTETVLFTGVKTSIQPRSSVRQHMNALPADARAPYVFSFFFKKRVLFVGDVKNRDILVDDQGERYQVEEVEWTLIGAHIRALKVEV